MGNSEPMSVREHLRLGQVIPAHPLALTENRSLDEARQRGLTRYYIDAGAGGVAVGVHTTQFAIRDSAVGLFRPVLELAMDEAKSRADTSRPFAMIAGVCGHTAQARTEAEIAAANFPQIRLFTVKKKVIVFEGDKRFLARPVTPDGFLLRKNANVERPTSNVQH